MPDYYDELKSRLDFMHEDSWAKADPVERALIATNEISGALLSVYRGVRDEAEHEALSAALARVYDEVIAPLDIPTIGPWTEGLVDRNAPIALGGLLPPLKQLLDRLLPRPE